MSDVMCWKQWAKTALRKMSEPGWRVRPKDEDWRGGVEGARAALECVAESGDEPYYTLQVFVIQNGLEGPE